MKQTVGTRYYCMAIYAVGVGPWLVGTPIFHWSCEFGVGSWKPVPLEA